MSLGQRIVFYFLFFVGSALFLVSGILAGDWFAIGGASFFLVAEGWALVYLELLRERDKYNLVRRDGEAADD